MPTATNVSPVYDIKLPEGEGEVDSIGFLKNTVIFIENKMTSLNVTDFKNENAVFDIIFEKLKNEVPNLKKLKVFIAFKIDENVDVANCNDCHFIDIFSESDLSKNIRDKLLKVSTQETIEDYLTRRRQS